VKKDGSCRKKSGAKHRRGPKERGMSLTGRVPHSARRTVGPRLPTGPRVMTPKNSQRGVTV
jgi:hypothetical protein